MEFIIKGLIHSNTQHALDVGVHHRNVIHVSTCGRIPNAYFRRTYLRCSLSPGLDTLFLSNDTKVLDKGLIEA